MTLKRALQTVFCTICLSSQAWAADTSVVDKGDSLRYLQDLRTQNVKRLEEIDKTLHRHIEETKSQHLETEVTALQTAKREHLLRQEFLDRLIFQIDTKFAGGDLRTFLERALVDMAKVDAVSSNAQSGLWKFLKYASDAIRSLPEKKENILSFLEGYMNRSVVNPVRPEDYLASRNYSNGSQNEAGSPLTRDQAGAFADRRLKEIQAKLNEQQPKVQQLRN